MATSVHSHDTQTAGNIATTTTTTTITTVGVDVNTQMINEQFFVDPVSGDDSYTGHEGSPWKTIAKVNAAALVPGDQVLFKRGETFSGKLAPVTSGDANRYILYGVYGTGARPIIDGTADMAFYVDSTATYFRVEHIDFAGSSAANNKGTVQCWTHDAYWYDCIFRDAVGGNNYASGFNGYCREADGSDVYNVTIDTCQAYNNLNTGINFGSSLGTQGPHDILITNCIAHDNGSVLYQDHGIYTRHGAVIENCTCYNNTVGAGIKVNCEGVHNSPYTPIVRNCISYGNHEGIQLDNVGSIVYNNLVYANTHNALATNVTGSDSLVYFNTFVNCTAGVGLVQFGASLPTGMVIKNNLFIQDRLAFNIFCGRSAGTITMANVAANNTIDYNIYYHGDDSIFYDSGVRTWDDWVGYGAEPHGILLANVPDFVTRYTDLHPANAGNLKNLGLCIPGYHQDIDENDREEPPTPGCYEKAIA